MWWNIKHWFRYSLIRSFLLLGMCLVELIYSIVKLIICILFFIPSLFKEEIRNGLAETIHRSLYDEE